VPRPGLEAFAERRVVLDNHVAQTERLAAEGADVDVVVWPENSSDIDPDSDETVAADIDHAARDVGAPILVGTIRYPSDGSRLNLAVLWEPGKGIVEDYAKQRPAAFAEYVPMRDVARFFSDKVDLVVHDMAFGTKVGLFDIEADGRTVVLGDAICFEVAYDDIMREPVAQGAEIMVVQTNNANFGYTSESVQQLAMTKLRAIENGRSTIQISTVGVSGAFLPDGTEVSRTSLFTPDHFVDTLPLRTSMTPATILGPVVVWAAEILAGAALLVVVAAAARRRRRSPRGRTPS
jgi:apolipoprotein N-acyltransferase